MGSAVRQPGNSRLVTTILGESLVVLDETWQQLQVDDGVVPGRYQVDDLAHGGRVFVARYHDGAGPDLERRQRYP